MDLNLNYMNARKLLVPALENINLVLIGCGGTGSWLAPAVAPYARLLTELGKNVTVTFIDPDQVEAKNVFRQNFCDAEVGADKAVTLANRYGLAWGVEIHAMVERFSSITKLPGSNKADTLTVLIGCVDTTAARLEIANWIGWHMLHVWWLDSGNKKTIGQVLLGRKWASGYQPLALDGYCSWLPLPSLQHPDLIDISTPEEASPVVDESRLSCAELAMRGSQSLSINFRMASIASEMLGKLLLTLDLEYYAVYVSEATGEMRQFINDDVIDAWVSQVTGGQETATQDEDEEYDELEVEDA
jgi:PRTRC genetic system ThiF family protein